MVITRLVAPTESRLPVEDSTLKKASTVTGTLAGLISEEVDC